MANPQAPAQPASYQADAACRSRSDRSGWGASPARWWRAVNLALILALAAGLFGGDDAWAQGRPAEALPGLLATAASTGAWQAWYDAGLCAADAHDRGRAVACLLRARRLAPAAREPRLALVALDANGPILWTDHLGPLALPGTGWPAAALALAGGLAAGWWLGSRRRRGWILTVALVLVILPAPGWVAALVDAGDAHGAILRDTQLLDATGSPLQAVAAGTVVERLPGAPWAGRQAVRLVDGHAGFLAVGDLD